MRGSVFGRFDWKQQRILLVALLLSVTSHAQDLCNTLPSGAVAGGFTFTGPAVGCEPFAVTIQDNSGGTDIKYYYYYKGGGLSELATLTPTTALTETYLGGPTTWTILQVGKKGGRDMYACKNITVRPNNQPLFTYNSCNNRILNLVIPNVTANNFDSYKIDWGEGLPETVISLPYEGRKNYTIPTPTKTIKVEGIYNNPNACPAPSFQTVSMSEGGNYANIDELVLNNNLKEINLKFNGLDLPYNLFKRRINGVFSSSVIERQVAKGNYSINLQDTLQYCFSAFRNSGGCFESAGEVCTTPLLEVRTVDKSNIVLWALHPTGTNNILMGANGRITSVNYNIIRTEKESGIIKIFNDVNTPFIDNADCQVSYCYKVETQVEGFPKFGSTINYKSKSTSNEICVDRKSLKPPPITNAFATVNSKNSVGISFTDNSTWSLNKEIFRLHRVNGNTVAAIDSTKNRRTFNDQKVNTDSLSYCYQINYTDECGSTSQYSPTFCTLHLSETNNNLVWTAQSPFANQNAQFYEVISLNEQTNTPALEIMLDSTKHTHAPDLTNFDNFARYQIRTIDRTGKESVSNVLTIPIKAAVFLPTAFTPNGDTHNPNFLAKGNFGRIIEFSFSVYNRWGETVFFTKDKTVGWDGKINGANAPTGNYSYRITAKTNTGENIEQKGMVLLMR